MPDPREPDPAGAPMTPQDAMARMASVTSHTRGLRVRTEGLTLIVWAMCIAASYLTIVVPILAGGHFEPGGPGDRGFNSTNNSTSPNRFADHGPPPSTAFFAWRAAPLAWYVAAIVVTAAVWRSASLSFQTGMTTPRLVAVLVGWSLLFVLTVFTLSYIEKTNPRSWHLLAWALVLALFAILNPLRFTSHSRWAGGAVAAVVLATAAYAYVADLGPRDTSFLSGIAFGVPGLIAGLYLMLRG